MKERYLRSVCMLMDCPYEEKERLLSRLDNAVTTFLEDVPDANEADIISNFGTPEVCATRLSAECAPKAVAAERRKKVKYHRAIVAILSVVMAISVSVAAYLWFNGGLVIIQIDDGWPNFMKELPSNHIIYDYDN